MSDNHNDNNQGDDDEALFSAAMSGVKPIKQTKKIIRKKTTSPELVIEARRAAAQQHTIKDTNYLTGGEVEIVDAFYPLSFKREGVQHGVFRKLKQGKYQQEARLDLHRRTVEQARVEVFEFIRQCYAYDLRVVVIVHGRGTHNQSRQALLKSYVNKWLPEMEQVQAFCSAQPQHGGLGAVYVQLKKTENLKQHNRERITRGRID